MNEANLVDGGPSAAEKPKHIRFKFHAEGGEYFRIWMVNLTLTILTLGIYSAWAKVRTKRYFYGNTELDGDRFDYLANPVMILKGRLIAIGALIVYTLVQLFWPLASFAMLAALAIAMPWIVMRALRFNAVMSSWRGIRFGFDGTAGGAAAAYLGWPLFGLITLGFGMPYAWYRQNQYLINNHRFGRTAASTSARPAEFFRIFFALMGAALAGALPIFVFTVGVPAAEGAQGEVVVLGLAFIAFGYFLVYLWMYAIYQAMHFRAVYNNVSVADNQVRTDVTVRGWFSVVAVNSILLILTLGFYYPWASVRMRRYIFSRLWVLAEDLDSFIADETDHTTALGEEIGETFDLGIGV